MFLLIGSLTCAYGQNLKSEVVDSLQLAPVRTNVLDTLDESIVSSDSLKKAMSIYIEKNPSRGVSVYRLRIFFDNRQDSRIVSEEIALEFSEMYPDVPVFRGYINPYFKVTVGNFRTKSDAMKFMQEIKEKYPSVFLVRELFSTI